MNPSLSPPPTPLPTPLPSLATDVYWWTSAAGLLGLTLLDVAPAWVVVSCLLALAVMRWRGAVRDAALMEKLHRIEADSRADAARGRREFASLEAQSRLGNSALLQLIDGVVVLATDLKILLINPSAIRLLGMRDRDQPIGRSFTELVRDPTLTQLIGLAISERQPQESLFEFYHGQGVVPLRIRVDVIDDQESFKVQLSLRDETESRQLEGMRREFIANVSHELKTPLAAIKGYAETVQLAVTDDPEMAVHFMNSIMTQCVRLEQLVADMMQLARAQSGRAQMHLVSVSLRDRVAESVRTYAPVAVASGLELNFHDEVGSAKVIADAEAALTIANNLIGNAIRYTPRGGRVDVSLRRSPGHWSLIVVDTGVGIPEQDQTKIFERFYRGSRSVEMSNSSTGLGLAIVKHLTIAQGGSVSVHSQPGKGSTFIVELPAVEPKSVNPAAVDTEGMTV